MGGDPARAATVGVKRKRDPLLGSNKHSWENPGRPHSNSNGSQHLNAEEMRHERVMVTVLNREKAVPERKTVGSLEAGLHRRQREKKRFTTSSLTAFTGGLRARICGNV